MADFTHLHVHSHYSLLDGLGKINPLLVRAKELDMDSIALTDHGAMYGAIEFIKAAHEVGIKPIVGLETYLAPLGHTNKRGKIDANPRHLTLLAHNFAGYKNLISLTTAAHLHGYYYKPRIDYELLKKHSDGLIVLSGCLNGDISRAIIENRPADAERLIAWHYEVFGRNRFYLEVQHHPHLPAQQKVNDALIAYGAKYKLHLVATADTHYIHSDDAQAHDVLICVQTGKTVDETDRLSMLDDDYSLKSPADMKEVWRHYPAAIDNTQRIAAMCDLTLEFGVNHLPRFPLPHGKTADVLLREKCEEGLQHRYSATISQESRERLTYELDVIAKTGFASYFLIVADFVNEAKRRGILVGPGRGSAAGSLVAYLLRITNIDPLAYNLLFERFLNPERVSMPDIDLDFADDRRDEIIAYVREKYGHEHVAQIITFGTMAARASVRDAGRALGLPYAFCDRVAKAIPPMMNFEEALGSSSELKELYDQDPQVQRLVDTAKRLEGVCRHASTHAAGVVITDEPITEYVPLQISTTGKDDGDTVTQYAMGSVESLGLLKIDFLGLKNLTIIQNTLERIRARHGVEIDIDTLPTTDAITYTLLQDGKSTGVFQLESAGMKRYLKELKPTEFEDIISILALYRPGPMDSIPSFIAAKHGRKQIQYLHPSLEPILARTYGVIVTQDQVLQIAREFAGFSYAEADILRKAVGKKIKALLDEQREKFISGAVTHRGVGQLTAKKVWDFIEPFARYGFNRAHAACYAMIAYQTAYLKSHYPADFMAALLTSDEGNIDRAGIEIAEALAMGLKILPPDVNESEYTFTVVKTQDTTDAIRFGLGAIKNVGQGVVQALCDERQGAGKFQSLSDVFARLNSKDFNRKAVESMARAGAFDSLAERQSILENVDRLLLFNKTLHKQQEAGQQGLFGKQPEIAVPRLNLAPATPAAKEERLRWEKQLLGIYVSEHPLSELQADMHGVVTPLNELKGIANRETVRVAGVVDRLTKITTKSNQPMLFVQIEDMTDKAEVLVFPSILEKTKEQWHDGSVLIIEGKVSDKDGETKILVDRVWALNPENLTMLRRKGSAPVPRKTQNQIVASSIQINIGASCSKETLNALKAALAKRHTPEGLPVTMIIPQQGRSLRVDTPFRLPQQSEAVGEIKQIIGHEAVAYR